MTITTTDSRPILHGLSHRCDAALTNNSATGIVSASGVVPVSFNAGKHVRADCMLTSPFLLRSRVPNGPFQTISVSGNVEPRISRNNAALLPDSSSGMYRDLSRNVHLHTQVHDYLMRCPSTRSIELPATTCYVNAQIVVEVCITAVRSLLH